MSMLSRLLRESRKGELIQGVGRRKAELCSCRVVTGAVGSYLANRVSKYRYSRARVGDEIEHMCSSNFVVSFLLTGRSLSELVRYIKSKHSIESLH
jgi:hypothetical protein